MRALLFVPSVFAWHACSPFEHVPRRRMAPLYNPVAAVNIGCNSCWRSDRSPAPIDTTDYQGQLHQLPASAVKSIPISGAKVSYLSSVYKKAITGTR